MNKKVIALVVVLLIILAAILTCPDKQDHKQVVLDKLNESVSEEIISSSHSEISAISTGFSLLGVSLVTKFVEQFVDDNFDVNDYLLFSTGVLTTNDKSKVVSFGIFGHIFCGIDQEKVHEAINK